MSSNHSIEIGRCEQTLSPSPSAPSGRLTLLCSIPIMPNQEPLGNCAPHRPSGGSRYSWLGKGEEGRTEQGRLKENGVNGNKDELQEEKRRRDGRNTWRGAGKRGRKKGEGG